MTPDQQAVIDANAAFYAALNSSSLEAMSEVWFPADWAECVHPGWTSLRGWEAVRESWRLIFDGSARLAVSADEVRVRIVGDVAWACCLERIATADADQIHTSLAQATNLFVRHDGRWRMVVHHASIVPHLTPHVSAESGLVN
jgi:ketosteroid isomerase-like protein